MKNLIAKLTVPASLVVALVVQADVCPDFNKKYKDLSQPNSLSDRLTVYIPDAVGANGKALINDIEGGYECIKAARDPKNVEWDNILKRGRRSVFCSVQATVDTANNLAGGIVKSVAAAPQIIGDIGDLGDDGSKELMKKDAQYMQENVDNPFSFLGGSLVGIPLSIGNLFSKSVSAVSHHIAGSVDTLVSYNIGGLVKSVATTAEGIFLLEGATVEEGTALFGCSVVTLIPNLFMGRKVEVIPVKNGSYDDGECDMDLFQTTGECYSSR